MVHLHIPLSLAVVGINLVIELLRLLVVVAHYVLLVSSTVLLHLVLAYLVHIWLLLL